MAPNTISSQDGTEDRLARLRGLGGGVGIGSRGPGETKIELDRRRIRTRMAKLRRDLARLAPARSGQRASRRRSQVPAVAIVGYTNAGKLSLFNRLTEGRWVLLLGQCPNCVSLWSRSVFDLGQRLGVLFSFGGF